MKKLNKIKGTPTPSKLARVMDLEGNIYHPTKAPEGLCKCGVMLELKPRKTDYIFPSRARALHAREHTIRYLFQNNMPVDKDNFIVEAVM